MVSFARQSTDAQLVELVNSVSRAQHGYQMASRRGAQNRRRQGVPSQGASADYHYRNEGDWLWMSELAWDLFRNDYIVGSIVDRAIEQTLQGGIQHDPDTGDKGLDRELKAWWAETTEDARECSSDAELTFHQQEEMVLRAVIVGGDILALPLDDGTVELVEGYRLRSPKREIKERPFHGVEFVPGSRRRAAYWLLNDDVNPSNPAIVKANLTPYLAWTDDGERNVWHVRFPKRPTQTRGITAFAPLFDPCAYNADLQFLQMVKARAQNVFAFLRSRVHNFDPAYLAAESKIGPEVTRDGALDKELEYLSNRRQYSQVGAGSVIDSLPGETITMASPNTPNAEFFQHYKTLLTFVGVNLGMPLVMALMDASETNFSGYRGAVDQARMGFRKNQQRLVRLFHTPYRRFKLLRRADPNAPEYDPAIAKRLEQTRNRRSKINLFGGRWNAPGWPYIEPGKDAAADLIRRQNMLSSPRRIARERGEDFEEIGRETVEDGELVLGMAIDAASRLYERAGGRVEYPWLVTTILQGCTSQNTSVSIQASDAQSPQPVGAAEND